MTDQTPPRAGGDAYLKAFLPGLILGLVLGGLLGAVVVPLLSNNAPKPVTTAERGETHGPRERGEGRNDQPGGGLVDEDQGTPATPDDPARTDQPTDQPANQPTQPAGDPG